MPLLNITDYEKTFGRFAYDYDLLWQPSAGLEPLLTLIGRVASGREVARAVKTNRLAFQITRGADGVSL